MTKSSKSHPAPMAKIKAEPKLPKVPKGKTEHGPKVRGSASRPAGGGKKGY